MYIHDRKSGLKCIYKVGKWAQNVYTMLKNRSEMYIHGVSCIYI